MLVFQVGAKGVKQKWPSSCSLTGMKNLAEREGQRQENTGRDRGFTLVELLVVIAVIAILAVLLLTAASSAQRKAKSTACKNNLRQIALFIAIYGDEFKRFPFGGPDYYNGIDPPWSDFVSSQETNRLRCPALGMGRRNLATANRNIAGYGFNYDGSSAGPWGLGATNITRSSFGLGLIDVPTQAGILPGFPISEVIAPADLIAVADSRYYLVNAQGDTYGKTIVGPWNLGRGRLLDNPWPSLRHYQGANAVFCDGHTEYAKQMQWVAQSDAAMARWNNDHKPHRETWGPPPQPLNWPEW